MSKRASSSPDVSSVHVRIPTDLAEWLTETAERRMVSVAFLVTAAVNRLRTQLPTDPFEVQP